MSCGHTIRYFSTTFGTHSVHITYDPPEGSTVWDRTVYSAKQVGNFLSRKLEQSSGAVVAIYLRIVSFVTSGRSDIPSPDSYSFIFKQQLNKMSDDVFYEFIKDSFRPAGISDEELLLTPNIDKHSEVFSLSTEKQNICLQEFMYRDLEDKRLTTHKGLTKSKNSFMMNQDPFIKIFTDHLRRQLKLPFYSEIASRAVEISRGNPTSDYPLGTVMLCPTIRSSNQSTLNNLSAEVDRACKPIVNYIQYLNNFPSTEEPLTYVQWQCPECNPARSFYQ